MRDADFRPMFFQVGMDGGFREFGGAREALDGAEIPLVIGQLGSEQAPFGVVVWYRWL